MRVSVHMNKGDLQAEINRDLPEAELRAWAYQRYIKPKFNSYEIFLKAFEHEMARI